MKNKQLCLLSIISSGLLVQADMTAAPLVSIGDNTDIFFNGSSSLRWASNIFRDEDSEVDDLTWTLSPGFEINVGRGASNADFSVITRYDVVRYQDNDELDVELFHIKALGSYKTSRLDVSGSVAYDENKSSSGESNITDDLIEFDTVKADLNAEYRVSPKFSFGSGFRYSETEYQTYTYYFADRESLTVPVDVFYELTSKVDLSLGYSYTNTDVDATLLSPNGDYTRESSFYNIGARGLLLPKVTGSFKVGYRTQDNDRPNSDDSGMLGLDANFSWSATPKLTMRLDLSRDFGVAGEGQSTENTSVDVSAAYSINSYFAASANLGYTVRDYTNTGRDDDQYNAGLRFSYSPNQYWSFSSGYTYSENSSNEVGRSYDNHTVDLTATLRY
ncbi:outer membrane beta-barrel protein [Coraliomargarita sp. SDUM461004]|uniref:Outer membrane beta-barrel protein n=1 Tax=Thalassobacterium sedimentorum TaxID=3041258 RepID=A0ABU1AEV5_9BACT|nr:outer membrane beta-barrel protein [Coraliomargarita sp. SDUM461004]MDQ8193054.1 outer membrane beta-barrel protein [Coraliomargarita sp. SDUM461004]